jgi:multiple sugar transport system ATP-binding protein
MATLELRRLNKTHADGFTAVDDVDLTIGNGELFVLVGPSGCGKTTVLRAVAGLGDLTHGDVLIDGVVVNDLPTGARDVAMVFQSNVLYPHLTVRDNIAFPLKLGKLRKSIVDRRVDEVAALLQLTDLLDRLPSRLSGGQQQRVAIGRAIIRRPRLMLMDEPLSSLDSQLRTEMRSQIVNLQHRLGVTTLFVTHDQVEAMAMGDRAAIMRNGRIVQQGTPLDLYRNPLDLFVAQFIGTPMMNLVCATVVAPDGRPALRVGAQTIALDEIDLARLPGAWDLIGSRVALGVRAESLRHDARGELVVSALSTELHGSDRVAYASLDADRVALSESGIRIEPGPTTIAVTIAVADPVDIYQPFRLAVETTALHLFDLTTGATIGRRPAPPAG